MRFLGLASIFLIITIPFLIILSVLRISSLNDDFYSQKFLQYNVEDDVQGAVPLHEKIIDYVKGRSESAPNELNEREKQHLGDVRKMQGIATLLLYVFIVLFAMLLIASSVILRINNHIINFIGKAMVFGGILTIILAVLLLFFITSDFSSAFDSFHQLLFKEGTYTFDPATNVLVRLYPEEIFQDLGSRISKGVLFSSIAVIAIGSILLFKTKPRKK